MSIRCARRVMILGCAVLVPLFTPPSAAAYFERFNAAARSWSLGGAFVALADDPAATSANAAGLTQVTRPSFLASYLEPYGIADLEEHYFAAAVPLGRFGLGASWHRFALEDATSEDLFTLGLGWDYIRTSQDASLSFGGSIDIARVAVAEPFDDARTRLTGSLGVLLRPFPLIGFGYSIRNIGNPAFEFVPGGGKTRLRTEQAFGVAYHWERKAILLFEKRRAQDGRWRQSVGIEVQMRREFSFRTGLSAGDVTGGIGVEVRSLSVDVGVTTHDVLGVTYMFSIGYKLPGGPAEVEW